MNQQVCALILVIITRSQAQTSTPTQPPDGYYGNFYGILDNAPASTHFFNPTEYGDTAQSQALFRYQPSVTPAFTTNIKYQYPQLTQQTAYTQYLQNQQKTHNKQPNTVNKYLPTSSQSIITPVQHSTMIHHTPYSPGVTTRNNPQIGTYVNLQTPLQHPLQKPAISYQQYPQHKLLPVTQYYPNTNPYLQQQHTFTPVQNPIPAKPANQKQEKEKEEAAEEEEEEDDEERGELNEEEDDEEENENENYQEDDEDDEEEEKPKYTNYSYHSSSKDNDNDDEDEEERGGKDRGRNGKRGGYRVEEDDEDDVREEPTHALYHKKTPVNYTKFEKKPPIIQNKFQGVPNSAGPYQKYTFSRGHQGKPKIEGIQSRPSQPVPVVVKKMVQRKWYITKKTSR